MLPWTEPPSGSPSKSFLSSHLFLIKSDSEKKEPMWFSGRNQWWKISHAIRVTLLVFFFVHLLSQLMEKFRQRRRAEICRGRKNLSRYWMVNPTLKKRFGPQVAQCPSCFGIHHPGPPFFSFGRSLILCHVFCKCAPLGKELSIENRSF